MERQPPASQPPANAPAPPPDPDLAKGGVGVDSHPPAEILARNFFSPSPVVRLHAVMRVICWGDRVVGEGRPATLPVRRLEEWRPWLGRWAGAGE